MSTPPKKQCKHCRQWLGSESFNADRRRTDGLAATCRSCINRRRRQGSSSPPKQKAVNLAQAARRGKLTAQQLPANLSSEQYQVLLWKTVQDFQSIKKTPQHTAQAKLLIQTGAVPEWPMVCEAAKGGHQDLVDLLLEQGAAGNIFVAAAVGDERAVSTLLKADQRLAQATTQQAITPLHYCASSALGKHDDERNQSFVRCATTLVAAGANVNATATFGGLADVTPMQCVCWSGGNAALFQILLDNKASLAGCLAFALGHFQRHGAGHYDLADKILTAGINIHKEGDAMLGRFAAHGDARAVEWLLRNGADPNFKTEQGWSPLHSAAERNTGTNVIKLLLEYGADQSAKNFDGHTPLDLARLNQKQHVVECLEQSQPATHKSNQGRSQQ